jgi:hypothetical protein
MVAGRVIRPPLERPAQGKQPKSGSEHGVEHLFACAILTYCDPFGRGLGKLVKQPERAKKERDKIVCFVCAILLPSEISFHSCHRST